MITLYALILAAIPESPAKILGFGVSHEAALRDGATQTESGIGAVRAKRIIENMIAAGAARYVTITTEEAKRIANGETKWPLTKEGVA
jgi:hypothetical protein